MEDEALIARNVRLRMEAKALNPKTLSIKAGLNETYVRDLLKGRSRNPRQAHLQQLALALDCRVSDLSGEKEPAGVHQGAIATSGYGQRITAIRTERGETETEFAAGLGVPVELLKLWETEALPLDHSALARFWQVGISADWLLFGDPYGRDQPIKPQSPYRRTAA